MTAADICAGGFMQCSTRLDLLAAVGEDADGSPAEPSAVARLPAKQRLSPQMARH